MAALEVKSVARLLGTPVPYAYAVKAGPWLFLTGHEAYDCETGIPQEVAGPPGFPLHGHNRSRREGDFILQRMRKLLGEFGTDLAHSVRLDQYYPNPKAVAAYHLSRHAEFRDYIPPSTSVVMERCFCADATISTSLIAVMPEPGYEIRKIHPPGVASAPTSGFVPAVVCNDFVNAMQRLANPKDGGQYSFYYKVIQGWDSYAAGKAKSISGIKCQGTSTIVFNLTAPTESILHVRM